MQTRTRETLLCSAAQESSSGLLGFRASGRHGIRFSTGSIWIILDFKSAQTGDPNIVPWDVLAGETTRIVVAPARQREG